MTDFATINLTSLSLDQALNEATAGSLPNATATSYDTEFMSALDTNALKSIPTSDIGQSAVSKALEVVDHMVKAKEELQLSLSPEQALSPAELLRIQMDIFSMVMQTEIVAKCVGKNNQNIDTLMKAQ